jgi:hypothetical protein
MTWKSTAVNKLKPRKAHTQRMIRGRFIAITFSADCPISAICSGFDDTEVCLHVQTVKYWTTAAATEFGRSNMKYAVVIMKINRPEQISKPSQSHIL